MRTKFLKEIPGGSNLVWVRGQERPPAISQVMRWERVLRDEKKTGERAQR